MKKELNSQTVILIAEKILEFNRQYQEGQGLKIVTPD